jgi:disulfide bond formation protein DsbB
MNRYAAIPWPWVGLVLCVALLAQEALVAWFGTAPALAEAMYRVGVMTIGVACLALILLPPRRVAYLLGFLVCAALIGWALWLQYGEGLEPCPLCMFQRVAVIAVGVVFLFGAIANPLRPGAAFVALLTLLVAGAGAAFAGRQIWAAVAAEGPGAGVRHGLSYMMETLPCHRRDHARAAGQRRMRGEGWVFLGLSIAGWTFVFFVGMIVAAIALIRRD